jgi:hypothetical protein
MIIAQQEAREELDLVVTKGRGRSGHGSGHDSNLTPLCSNVLCKLFERNFWARAQPLLVLPS